MNQIQLLQNKLRFFEILHHYKCVLDWKFEYKPKDKTTYIDLTVVEDKYITSLLENLPIEKELQRCLFEDVNVKIKMIRRKEKSEIKE